MNHKRGKPKHQRAGCIMCKPHKDERGAGEEKPSVRRKLVDVDLRKFQKHLCERWGSVMRRLADIDPV